MIRTLTQDDYVRGPSGPECPKVSVAYRIAADAHPDVLLRIAAVLNLANRAPWSATLQSSGVEQVLIEIALREIPGALAYLIQGKLTQLTCVTDVEVRPWP